MRILAVVFGFVMISALGLAGCSGGQRDGTPYSYKEFKKDAKVSAKYIWGPVKHPETRHYLETADFSHTSQWENDDWKPQDWIVERGGSAMAVINGLYDAGIILDQYVEDDVPVLEVGQAYVEHLSSFDQRRVAAFVDHVFSITTHNPAGSFRIVFNPPPPEKRKRDIGLFTANGLQLQ